MHTFSENNKQIAKNTFYLYCRVIFVMFVSLYTSRVVLQTLGVVDFGIYNIVGGVVLLFSSLNGALTSAVQRYISFELAKGVSKRLNNIFCMSVNVHLILALLILLLAETFGLYFLKHQLNIPLERMSAAIWVYQCSTISFIITVIQVPYISCVIAHEKMNIFATISIFEISAKLLAVIVLPHMYGDSLIWYAIFILLVTFSTTLCYKTYTSYNFKECRYHKYWNKSLFREMMSFSSWTLWGGISYISSTQGINILLNIFFGPTINAARGIAYQVNSALCSFNGSLTQAINPQIVKQYSMGNLDYMHQLIFRSSRFSYFLLLLFACPIFLETHAILKIWLGTVPDYTVLFCRLVLISSLIDSLSSPFSPATQATGKVKAYYQIVGFVLFMNLPITYITLKITNSPQYAFYIGILISFLTTISRIIMCKKVISFSIYKFIKIILCQILPVSIISMLPLIMPLYSEENYCRIIGSLIIEMGITLIAIWFIGIEKNERSFILNSIKKRLNKTT